MDHPSDASSITGLQNCISKLFSIENIVTYLGYQLQQVSASLVGAAQQMDPERMKAEGLALMSQMTTQELMLMANIENERQAIMAAWRRVESQKQQIIMAAKGRFNAGRAGQ